MKNSGKKVLELLAPTLLLSCFIPFLILCFYCFPSVDDYSFANITESYGYIGGQIHWYTTWTGRYFSTAILSFAPALIYNFILYHLVSLIILMGSLHSIYFLIRSLDSKLKKWHALIIALAASLCYLLFLPDVTEAFYWFPGSITYQLASILATYLFAIGIRVETGTRTPIPGWLLMSIMAFAVVGSNEVIMLVTAILVTLYYLLSVFRGKGLFNGRLLVFLTAAFGSVLLVFAPGNTVRAEGDLSERNFDQLSEAFSLAFGDLFSFFGQYFWIPVLPLLLLSMLYFSKPDKTQVKWGQVIMAIILIIALVFSVIFPTYYIYKIAPPLRTQNFNLWILVTGCIVLGRFLAPLVPTLKLESPGLRVNIGAIGFLALIFLFSGFNGTRKAYADLFSGSANKYKNQYSMRAKMLTNCSDSICTVPAYTAYPYTTFHSDLSSNHGEWWNFLYGKFNGEKEVSVDFSALVPFYTHTIDFKPSNTHMENYNIENLTDSMSLNSGYSYYMSPDVTYGGGLAFRLDTIETRFGNQPAYIRITADAVFADTLRNMHVVSVINHKGSANPISWRSVTWVESEGLVNGWDRAEILIPLYTLNLHFSDQFKIFLWNPEKRDAFVDNITFTLY